MSLTNKTIANTYKDLLQVDNSNNGLTTTPRRLKDGSGVNSALKKGVIVTINILNGFLFRV